MSLRSSVASCALVSMAMAVASPAHARTQQPEDRPLLVHLATLRDAQRRVVGYAQRSPQGFWITPAQAQLSIAYVCDSEFLCAPVVQLIPCVDQVDVRAVMYRAPLCPQGALRIAQGPWQSWAPNTPPPVETDRCAGLSDSPWTHAGGAQASVTVGNIDGGHFVGGTVVNSYRRLAVAYEDRALAAHTGCDDASPRGVISSRLLGSEFGFDVRAQVLARVGAPATDLHTLIGIAPIAKAYFARGRLRLPSLLGWFLPEVGWAMRSRSYDENGLRISNARESHALYVRAGGWTASWMFSRVPAVSLDLSVAPWIEIPFTGQPVVFGASASVGLSFVAW